MRILIIDSVCGLGSTGRLCKKAADKYSQNGHMVRIAYGRESFVPEDCKKYAVRIGHWWDVRWHALMTRLFDFHAFGPVSRMATSKFLKWADEYNPDFLWLNSIHGYHINAEMLFRWIKTRPQMKVEWTQHDCWAFTGHCSHFLLTGCERWKSGCFDCPEKREYPKCLGISGARRNWEWKKDAFCGIRDMTLVSPSKWVAGLIKQSFLKDYNVRIQPNTIDQNVFHPTPSNIRNTLGVKNKMLILGVASDWDRRKGFDDFLLLRTLLDNRFEIVMIGLTQRQINSLPSGVLGITRTNDAIELAKYYSAADWFFNPTHEDTFPTVNLEARACCCKIATYDTGGSAETIEGYEKGFVLKGKDKRPEGFARLVKSYLQGE